MWSQPPVEASGAGIPRRAILLWTAVFSLVIGLLQFARPLDDMLRTGRNMLRSHEASGDVVVVAIDDRSIEKYGRWPWSRAQLADLVDAIDAAGASRIAIAENLSGESDSRDDAKLAESLSRFHGPVGLAVRLATDPRTGRATLTRPPRVLAAQAELVAVNLGYNSQNRVWRMAYGANGEAGKFASLASFAAGRRGPLGETFPIDYATQLASVPVVTAQQLLDGRVSKGSLVDKSVVVGTTSQQFSDTFFLPGNGLAPSVYVHALGAETLRGGLPYRLWWPIPLVAAILAAAAYLFGRPAIVRRSIWVVGFSALLAGPIWLESKLIFAEVMPALMMMGGVAVARRWFVMRIAYRSRGRTNAVSGLPNLDALREDKRAAACTLVAARVQNFAEIVAALPESSERALVEQIAARLAMGARGEAIYQGDEGVFVWLATDGPFGALGDQLDALHAICRTPVPVAGAQVDLNICFGIDAETGRSVANRIGAALVAAGEAAADGRHWKLYDPAKLKDAAWNLSLLGRLDSAIDSGEIWVAYQPKLDLATGQIDGAEALVRWNHAEKGEIGPADFIPAAEQHNRIDKLTAFVLEDGIRAAAQMNAAGHRGFEIAVNLSARLLDRADLLGRIQDLLRKHGVAPSSLTLEVTESAALTGHDRSLGLLEELRASGLNIAIDDYGTGFSSLSYLRKLPANEIKIDRSQSDRLLVDSTIHLAHSLGRTVVAEGVETPEVLRALEAMGCDKAQGFLIGRPVPLRQFARLMSGGERRFAA